MPHVNIFCVQMPSCEMFKLDHVYYSSIYTIDNHLLKKSSFSKTLIKKFIEIYGHP